MQIQTIPLIGTNFSLKNRFVEGFTRAKNFINRKISDAPADSFIRKVSTVFSNNTNSDSAKIGKIARIKNAIAEFSAKQYKRFNNFKNSEKCIKAVQNIKSTIKKPFVIGTSIGIMLFFAGKIFLKNDNDITLK